MGVEDESPFFQALFVKFFGIDQLRGGESVVAFEDELASLEGVVAGFDLAAQQPVVVVDDAAIDIDGVGHGVCVGGFFSSLERGGMIFAGDAVGDFQVGNFQSIDNAVNHLALFLGALIVGRFISFAFVLAESRLFFRRDFFAQSLGHQLSKPGLGLF